MLAGLFRDAVAELVHDTLEALLALTEAPHPALIDVPRAVDGAPLVVVVGDLALGRALVATGRRRGNAERRTLRIAAPPGARAARKLEGVLEVADPEALPLAPATAAVLVGVGAMAAAAPRQRLAAWRRAILPGGGLILVDRCPPTVATRHALCSGVVELEQRHSGRAVITSGLMA